MNKSEVPLMIYNPPKNLRAASWSVSYSPLGAPQKQKRFKTKIEAIRFAREVFKGKPVVLGTGLEVPWDVTVSFSTNPLFFGSKQ